MVGFFNYKKLGRCVVYCVDKIFEKSLWIYIYLEMLAHLIQHKGKGGLIVGMPLIVGFVLFVLTDGLSVNDKYNGAVTLLLSGILLFMLDNKRIKVKEGEIVQRVITLPRVKRQNTFMWIELRYLAVAMGLVGLVWLMNLL